MGESGKAEKIQDKPKHLQQKYICVWEQGDGGKMNSSQLLIKDYQIVAFIYG